MEIIIITATILALGLLAAEAYRQNAKARTHDYRGLLHHLSQETGTRVTGILLRQHRTTVEFYNGQGPKRAICVETPDGCTPKAICLGIVKAIKV